MLGFLKGKSKLYQISTVFIVVLPIIKSDPIANKGCFLYFVLCILLYYYFVCIVYVMNVFVLISIFTNVNYMEI